MRICKPVSQLNTDYSYEGALFEFGLFTETSKISSNSIMLTKNETVPVGFGNNNSAGKISSF